MKKTFEYIKIKPTILLFGGRLALAEVVGVTRMTVWTWEKETGHIPAKHTAKVKKALVSRKKALDKAFNGIMR
ncbi:MAG TPA: hypothetical protein ENI73_02055 [Spirochaetes bacterium]|nr:hypothetical protein [Spirochaetota bacterium]